MKNSQKRRSAWWVGEKSAGAAVRRAGRAERSAPSAGRSSGNMGGECTPKETVHKRRYVTFNRKPESPINTARIHNRSTRIVRTREQAVGHEEHPFGAHHPGPLRVHLRNDPAMMTPAPALEAHPYPCTKPRPRRRVRMVSVTSRDSLRAVCHRPISMIFGCARHAPSHRCEATKRYVHSSSPCASIAALAFACESATQRPSRSTLVSTLALVSVPSGETMRGSPPRRSGASDSSGRRRAGLRTSPDPRLR